MRSTLFVPVAGVMLMAACVSTSTTTTTATSTGVTGSPATQAQMSAPPADAIGKFVWHDLVTDEIAAAQKFYSGLLGWEFSSVTRNGQPYVIAHRQGQPIAGFVSVPPVPNQEASQWIGYQSVVSVDDIVTSVMKAGGGTLVAPVDIEAVGRAAVLRDPQGAPFGVVHLTGAAPADAPLPSDASIFWMEYLARNQAEAIEFYTETFSYLVRVTDRSGPTEYVVLSRDKGRPLAGILAAPGLGMRPVWLPYVVVSDPAAAVTKVHALGGRVLLEPNAGIRHGSLAIVADPSGAVVALQKYPF